MKRNGVIFVLFLTLSGFFIPRTAYAADPSTDQKTFFDAVDKCVTQNCTNKPWYQTDSVLGLQQIIKGQIVGGSDNPQSMFYNGNSAVAQVGGVITAMYLHPPADLIQWAADTGQTLGFLPKQAYAQGIGFSGLSPLLPIWKAFRNISYAILAVVMVVIGFMVMFRQKIDPKTVITVQNALPRIVLALILITFSYAIAAFFIDIMYLVMAILINLIVGASSGTLGADTASKYLNGGLGTVTGALFNGGFRSIDDLIKLIFNNAQQGSAPWFITKIISVITLGLYPLSQAVLLGLIVSIALLFGLVRIAFMLISAYIRIIVAVLIAPFQLMTVAIPGSNSLTSWLKNMLADLSIFPVTAAMLLVGTILTRSGAERIWTPPLLSGGGARGVTGLIGLGVLLTIPSIANGIKEALKAKAPVDAGVGAILGPLGAGAGQAMQLGYQGMFIASPFLHKTPASTPGGRQVGAAKGGTEGILENATGGGKA